MAMDGVRTLAALLEHIGGGMSAEALADAPPEDLAEIFKAFGVTEVSRRAGGGAGKIVMLAL
jgi:hypothetical protein